LLNVALFILYGFFPMRMRTLVDVPGPSAKDFLRSDCGGLIAEANPDFRVNAALIYAGSDRGDVAAFDCRTSNFSERLDFYNHTGPSSRRNAETLRDVTYEHFLAMQERIGDEE